MEKQTSQQKDELAKAQYQTKQHEKKTKEKFEDAQENLDRERYRQRTDHATSTSKKPDLD